MSKTMRLIVCGVLFAVIAAPGAALAGVPAWCAVEGAPKINSSSYELEKDLAPEVDPRDMIVKIVGNICFPDAGAAKLTAQIETARARLSKRYSMTEADWADARVWASEPAHMRGGMKVYIGAGQVNVAKPPALSTLTPFAQHALIQDGVEMGSTYFVDSLGSKLSEVGRLAYIAECVKTDNVAFAAMCLNDIQVLDRPKFYDEIRAEKARSGSERMTMRLIMDNVSKQIPAFLDRVKKWKAEDPGYAKMFAIAEAAQVEWGTRTKKEAALLDLVFAMDDARTKTSKKAYDGCAETTLKAFQAAVAKIPAKSFANENDVAELKDTWLYKAITAVANTPEGYLASVAYYTCMKFVSTQAKAGKMDPIAQQMGDVLQFWPGHRGPRSTTQSAILGSGIEFDDTTKKLDVPGVRRLFFVGGGIRGSMTQVGTLKKGDTQTTINPPKKSEKQQQCLGVKYSKKIVQIKSDGTLVYESWCTGWKSITVDVTPESENVDNRWVTSEIKPGMTVLVGWDMLIAAWPKGKPIPSVVLGVSVK
jgi:hypothetical protein